MKIKLEANIDEVHFLNLAVAYTRIIFTCQNCTKTLLSQRRTMMMMFMQLQQQLLLTMWQTRQPIATICRITIEMIFITHTIMHICKCLVTKWHIQVGGEIQNMNCWFQVFYPKNSILVLEVF
jgi:hypothetical protein